MAASRSGALHAESRQKPGRPEHARRAPRRPCRALIDSKHRLLISVRSHKKRNLSLSLSSLSPEAQKNRHCVRACACRNKATARRRPSPQKTIQHQTQRKAQHTTSKSKTLCLSRRLTHSKEKNDVLSCTQTETRLSKKSHHHQNTLKRRPRLARTRALCLNCDSRGHARCKSRRATQSDSARE